MRLFKTLLATSFVALGLGLVQTPAFAENIKIGAYLEKDKKAIKAKLEEVFQLFPRCKERLSQKAGSLSGGEQQMVAIARALMSRPRLLLCDEPSLGLAPLITKELFEVIARLNREEGLSVLLVEQNANLAMHMASRVYLLEAGIVVATGSAEELSADDTIRKAYLGF